MWACESTAATHPAAGAMTHHTSGWGLNPGPRTNSLLWGSLPHPSQPAVELPSLQDAQAPIPSNTEKVEWSAGLYPLWGRGQGPGLLTLGLSSALEQGLAHSTCCTHQIFVDKMRGEHSRARVCTHTKNKAEHTDLILGAPAVSRGQEGPEGVLGSLRPSEALPTPSLGSVRMLGAQEGVRGA